MSKRSFQVILASIVGLIFVFGDAICLYAQETNLEEFTLEEITVTAQKRSENQQKVAIAMDVIPADELKSLGKSDIDDILSNVSNVMVQKSADGMRVSLRGYSDSGGTNHGQSTSTPAVAVNQDGVYSSRKDGGSDLYDIDRVEVLFGPQSTMYASNSPGGIVNVETARPKIDKYEASGTLELGNFNLLHTEGMVNVPVNSIMSLRAAFQTKNHDGYISNGGDDEDSKSGRLKMLLQPNDKFSFNVTGELLKSTTHMSGSSVTGFINQNDTSNPWTAAQDLGSPNHDTTKKATGRVDWDLGVTSLSIVSAYSTHKGDRDEKMSFPGAEPDHWLYNTKGTEKSVEIRFTSAADFFFKWLVGFNYYKSNDWLNGLNYDASGNVKTGTAQNLYTKEIYETVQFRNSGSLEDAKAVFVNMTYPVTESFRATGGIRKSWDDFDFINGEVRGGAPGSPAQYEDTTGMVNSMSYSKPDYKLGVELDLGQNSMAYADYSTSYRVQAFGGGQPGASGSTHQEYPPEMLKAYTIGSKNRFLDNTLQLNAAAFYYDYKNFAAGDMVFGYYGAYKNGAPDPDLFDGSLITADQNGSTYGDGKWYGLDIQSTYLIGGDDSLNLSVSYLHSEWTNLIFDYYYDYKVKSGVMIGPGQSAAITDLAPADTVSYNGKSMTNSPEWTINLSYTHKFNFSDGSSIDGRIDSKFKSGYRMSWKDADYPYNYQESFVNGDLNGTYYSADGKYTISGYVKNVRDYAEKRAYFSGAGVELRIGSPRTYGAVLSVKF